MAENNKRKKKYRSFSLSPIKDRKLIILAAHRGFSNVQMFIKSIIDKAL